MIKYIKETICGKSNSQAKKNIYHVSILIGKTQANTFVILLINYL